MAGSRPVRATLGGPRGAPGHRPARRSPRHPRACPAVGVVRGGLPPLPRMGASRGAPGPDGPARNSGPHRRACAAAEPVEPGRRPAHPGRGTGRRPGHSPPARQRRGGDPRAGRSGTNCRPVDAHPRRWGLPGPSCDLRVARTTPARLPWPSGWVAGCATLSGRGPSRWIRWAGRASPAFGRRARRPSPRCWASLPLARLPWSPSRCTPPCSRTNCCPRRRMSGDPSSDRRR